VKEKKELKSWKKDLIILQNLTQKVINNVATLWYPAYIALAMFCAAMQSKALGVCLCFVIGLGVVYPAEDPALMLAILFMPAFLLASFRG
jgi:hypothetical protein